MERVGAGPGGNEHRAEPAGPRPGGQQRQQDPLVAEGDLHGQRAPAEVGHGRAGGVGHVDVDGVLVPAVRGLVAPAEGQAVPVHAVRLVRVEAKARRAKK